MNDEIRAMIEELRASRWVDPTFVAALIESLTNELDTLSEQTTPRPIETAPEVEDVLVWDGESWCMGLFGLCYYTQNYRWLVDGYQSENPLDYYQPCEPTYWLPLPPAPIKETK